MAVDIAGAMERGLDRVLTRSGAALVAMFVAVGVVADLTWETILARFVREYGTADSPFGFVPPAIGTELQQQWAGYEVLIDVAAPVASFFALLVLLWLVQLALRIGAIRWFVGEAARTLEAALFTRRLGWTVLNLIVGGILYGLAIMVGLFLLVVPGVFLAVALYFFSFEVVIEGENAIDALANSYALTAGDRIELFLIGLLFVLLGAIIGVIGVPMVLPGRLIPAILGAAATSAFGVYSIATGADLYRQLTEADEATEPADAEVA